MTNTEIIKRYLNNKGFEWRQRGDEGIMNCPFCLGGDTEQKFSINLSSGLFQCFHRNSCDAKGSFADLQARLGDKTDKLTAHDAMIGERDRVYQVPDQGKVNLLTVRQKPVYDYLVGRGFTIETIKHFRVGATDSHVLLPFFKRETLVNIKYRSVTEKKDMRIEKNAEPTLFNRDQVYDSTLIITEGEFDAMALYQYGIDAVSVPMGAYNIAWIETEWDYLETFESIILCFDNDTAGKDAMEKVAARIGEWKCRKVTLPKKDANACLVSGVTKEEIKKCFDNAVDFKPENIASPSSYLDKVQKLFSAGTSMFGIKTAWRDLDAILKGWRDGEVTIWSGRNGAGKSTILNQHLLDMGAKGIKTCVYSGEMPPEKYLRWAVIQHKENSAPHPRIIEESIRWMDGKIYILNISAGINPDDLFQIFEYAARRYGVKHFIVDSLMKVRLGGDDDYGKQKDFVSHLADFAKKHGVHVHLVAHPRKTMTDKDEPGKVDVKGSSHITDLADNLIVLYRPDQELKEKALAKGKSVSDCQMYIKKNREYGIEGKVHLYYSELTKKFSD